MKDPLFDTLSGLASLGIVLAAVLLASGGRDRPPATHDGQASLVAAVAAADLQAGEEAPVPQRKTRRVRASLSMPYFSFAQSLRPRG